MSGYMGHHAFLGLGLSQLVPKADCCVIVGIYTGMENHVVTATMSQASLNAQIVKLFGGTVSIIILEKILNIQERQPASSTARNLESPMHPTSKKLPSLYTVNTSVKAGAQIPHPPLGDDSSYMDYTAVCNKSLTATYQCKTSKWQVTNYL
jgi:hypothetical protein